MRRTASTASGALRRSARRRMASAMAPARRLGERAGFALGVVELAESGIGIGLQDAGIAGEMPCGMLAAAIARVEEHRRRRGGAGKRPIVAHIGPKSAGDRFPFGQHWHRRVVAVHAVGGKDVAADQLEERAQRGGAGADLIGQGRDVESTPSRA